jgi:hypothetical protein
MTISVQVVLSVFLPTTPEDLSLSIFDARKHLVFKNLNGFSTLSGQLAEHPLFVGFGTDQNVFVFGRITSKDVEHALQWRTMMADRRFLEFIDHMLILWAYLVHCEHFSSPPSGTVRQIESSLKEWGLRFGMSTGIH